MLKPLPKAYAWLADEKGPKMLTEALRHHGVQETAGAGNTPVIMRWARELGGDVAKVYKADSIPWCGLFVAYLAMIAGKSLPASPLWARAWASWGKPSPEPGLADVLVFVRPGGGHVGLYAGEDRESYHVFGGNQGDGVNIKRIAKFRCIAVRRHYRTVPANVRPVFMAANGPLSTNEA